MTKEKENKKTNAIDRYIPVKTKCFHGIMCTGYEDNPCENIYDPVWARLSGIGVLNNNIVEVWRPLEKTKCPVCGKTLTEFYDIISNEDLLLEILSPDGSLRLPMRTPQKNVMQEEQEEVKEEETDEE